MDISVLSNAKEAREKGIEVELKDPETKEPLGASVTIASLSSELVKRKAREYAKIWQTRQKRDPNFQPGLEEQEQLGRAMLVAAVISWDGLTDGEKPWPCTDEHKEQLVSDSVVSEQLLAAAGDEANFFKP